jgi:hypothetical protein
MILADHDREHRPQVELLDVNGDGVPDWLITARQGKHTLTVALNGIDGSPLS